MRGRDLGEAKEGTGGRVGVFESFVKTMEGRAFLLPLKSVIESARLLPGKCPAEAFFR